MSKYQAVKVQQNPSCNPNNSSLLSGKTGKIFIQVVPK